MPSGTFTPSTPRRPQPQHQYPQGAPDRLAPGLEAFVRWHEGRADPALIIRQMKEEQGKGRLEVMVCGPTSLLGAVKKATKDEMRVGDVWRGGVRVGYHEEAFGA
jgi:hypothetical protein